MDELNEKIIKAHEEGVNKAHSDGMLEGSVGILGAVLDLRNKRKTTVYDIKKFCQHFLKVQEK